MKTLGILTLGQTPRHDIEQLFTTCMPGVPTIIVGGLDNTEQDVIETLSSKKDDYPLLVILADTTTRQVPMQHLVPLLEEAAYTLSKQGADFVLLMCMGNFANLNSPVPVIYPGRLVSSLIASLFPSGRLGIIIPNAEQKTPAHAAWESRGFESIIKAASPRDPSLLYHQADQFRDEELDCIVLDCMGFNREQADEVQRRSGHRVICPQSLVAKICSEITAG